MRRLLLVVPLVAASSFAHAGGSTYTPLVDIREVDGACRPLAAIPLDTTIARPGLDAALSTASCLVTVRTRGLVLTASFDSLAALRDAVAPAIRILDRVIEVGDPEHAVLAEYAKSDIYDGNANRIMNAVPHLSPQIGRGEVRDHEQAVAAADRLTQALRQRAADCRRAIAKLVVLHPELATSHDVVVHYALAKARIVDASGIARR